MSISRKRIESKAKEKPRQTSRSSGVFILACGLAYGPRNQHFEFPVAQAFMAEKGGFEPPRPVIWTCTLSRGVHSTSLPLLRRDPASFLARSKRSEKRCRVSAAASDQLRRGPPDIRETKNSMIRRKKQKPFSGCTSSLLKAKPPTPEASTVSELVVR